MELQHNPLCAIIRRLLQGLFSLSYACYSATEPTTILAAASSAGRAGSYPTLDFIYFGARGDYFDCA